MQSKQRIPLRTVVLIGILSALVFALSWVQIVIPISNDSATRIHFGNIMCLLGGVLFGPLVGGLSAGFGSMLFDLSNPLYMSEFWITFLMKFAMGALAGLLAQKLPKRLPQIPRVLISALGGQLLYVLLYVCKTVIMQRWVYLLPWEAVGGVVLVKALASLLNGIIAVVCCTLVAPPLGAGLKAAGLFKPGAKHA